jgi:hypothetical protein
METDGSFSVISRLGQGSASTLSNVAGVGTTQANHGGSPDQSR